MSLQGAQSGQNHLGKKKVGEHPVLAFKMSWGATVTNVARPTTGLETEIRGRYS
jgi:hypothetical protein